MKLLLIQSPEPIRKTIIMSLDIKFNITPIEADSEIDAMASLASDPDIEVIISNAKHFTEDFVTFLSENYPNTPCILYAGEIPEDLSSYESINLVAFVSEQNLLNELYAAVEKTIKSLSGQETSKTAGMDSEFTRLRTDLMVRVSPLKTDVYIRLKDDHYVKLFVSGTDFTEEDRKKYWDKKKVEFLFIKNEESFALTSSLNSELQNLLATESLDIGLADEVTQATLISIQDLIDTVGVNDEVQEVINSAVDVTVQTMKNNKHLGGILQLLEDDKEGYTAHHSFVLGKIACAISTCMDWNSEATYQRLCLAAYLHDCTLKNNNLSMIRTLEELEERQLGFTEDEVNLFKGHPLDAAQIAKQFDEVPPDVDQIIAQHHELPNGRGFPNGFSAQKISPLASLFIVAHEMAFQLITLGHDFLLKDFIDQHVEIYNRGYFKKVLSACGQLDFDPNTEEI